jgi:hypothetical protein
MLMVKYLSGERVVFTGTETARQESLSGHRGVYISIYFFSSELDVSISLIARLSVA